MESIKFAAFSLGAAAPVDIVLGQVREGGGR